MLFATDKFALSSGDTAKLTIQYENTTLTNTGKKQAIVEASKDGYTWTQIASIAPESSLPLKVEALYIRLTTDTTVSVVNTNPIPRDTKKSDIAVNINTEALVIKDDLQAYVSKSELNDLVQHPDLSDYVTTRQLQDAIPDVPEIPDVSGLATKESVATKADQTALDELKLTVATKADSTTVAGLQTQLTNTIIPAISHLNDTKADKTELSTLSDTVALSSAQAQALATQVNGFQSQLDNRLTLEQAETANHVLLNAIATKASTEQLTAVQDEVEQKATKTEVADLANKAISLEQDKANRSDVDTLSATVKLLQALISGDIDGDLLDQTKEEIITSLNQTLPDVIKGMIPESLGQAELVALEEKLIQLIQTKTDTGHQHSMNDVTGLAEALAGKSDASHKHTWGSISGKPTSFLPSEHTHPISEVTGLNEALADKADKQHSHSWLSITDKPEQFTPTSHTHAMSDVTGLTTALAGKANTTHNHSWSSITDKPTQFTPTVHTHALTDVTGLQEQLDAKVTTGYAEATYAKKTELPQPVDLSGYATKQSVDSLSQAVNALSGAGDVDLSNLATKAELDGKANADHTHTMSQVTGLVDSLNSKAPRLHTHTVANVVGLQAALDGKADNGHSHTVTWDSITNKPSSFTPSTHTHSIADVTGLQEELATKVTNQQLTTALSQVSGSSQGWQVLTTRQNLNTMTTQGKYLIRVGSNTNAPITTGLCVVVEAPASDHITQTIWADSESNLMYVRVYNGAWRPWEKLTKNAISEINGLQAALDTKTNQTDTKYYAARRAPYASNITQNFDNLRGGDYLYYKQATHTGAVNPPPLEECVVFAEWCYASNDNHLVVTARSLLDGKIATRSKFQNTWSEWTQLTPSNDFATLRAEVEELKKLEPTGGSGSEVTELCYPINDRPTAAHVGITFASYDNNTVRGPSYTLFKQFKVVKGATRALQDSRWQLSGTHASFYRIQDGILHTSRDIPSLRATYGDSTQFVEQLTISHPAVLLGVPLQLAVTYGVYSDLPE